jgi:putative ABC transport system permease protein
MDVLRQDLRSAFAALRRAPAVSLTAAITLAVGIGATLAVYATVHGVLVRSLPYASPGQLVRLWEERPGGASPAGNRWLSRGTYVGWIEQMRTLDALGGYGLADFQARFGADNVKVSGARISPGVLGTLGIPPAAGRLLTEDDARDAGSAVVLLSDGLWRERFGASHDVVGRSLAIDGRPHVIVGVMPPGFAFPEPAARLWVPYVIPRSAAAPTGPFAFTALGRLKGGATLADAEAEGTAAARAAPSHRLTDFFFGKGGAPIVHARPLIDDMTVVVRPALSIVATAVMLVLLIACVNVAGLMLSQGTARQQEFAIRTAVGGSRARLVRQVFTESATVAIAGSVLGLLLALWLVHAVRAIAPPTLPRLGDVAIDGPVLGLWGAATVFAILVTGLVPALYGSRADPSDALHGSDRSSATGFRGVQARRLRDGLLVVEAALAIVLIVGASLLVRSFMRLVSVDNGYAPTGVLIAATELPDEAGQARTDQFIAQALERVRGLPGVTKAGASGMIPLMKQTAVMGFAVPDVYAGGKPTEGRARVYSVTPGYAEALGLHLESGRFFTDTDNRAGTLAILVNEEFVRQHLAVPQVIGLRLPHLIGGDGGRAVPAEIVGVVANVLKDGNDTQPQPELYFVHGAHGQRISGRVNLVIRTTGDPSSRAPAIRALVREVDRDVVIDRIEPLATIVAASLDGPRFAASVMGAFAGVAVLLAGIGLYGTLSYSIARRDRELGVRAALGARRRDLVGLVLGEGLVVVLPGIALGMLGAVAFARLMQELLFGVTPLDVVAFAAAPLAMIATALLACLAPALRAGATDPVVTLRK